MTEVKTEAATEVKTAVPGGMSDFEKHLIGVYKTLRELERMVTEDLDGTMALMALVRGMEKTLVMPEFAAGSETLLEMVKKTNAIFDASELQLSKDVRDATVNLATLLARVVTERKWTMRADVATANLTTLEAFNAVASQDPERKLFAATTAAAKKELETLAPGRRELAEWLDEGILFEAPAVAEKK